MYICMQLVDFIFLRYICLFVQFAFEILFTDIEIQDDSFPRRTIDNEMKVPKVTNRSNDNIKPQCFNTRSYVIGEFDMGKMQ